MATTLLARSPKAFDENNLSRSEDPQSGTHPMNSELQQTTVRYTGHVQGVGFRYTCKRFAEPLEVFGTVGNLRDGSVELVAEGANAEIEKLLSSIRQHFEDNITDELATSSPITGKYKSFSILT